MLITCNIAAKFKGPDGQVFEVTPMNRGNLIVVPDWVPQTLLFRLALRDGSIKAPNVNGETMKSLENDPFKGLEADMRKHPSESTEAVEGAKEAEKKTVKRTRKAKGADPVDD